MIGAGPGGGPRVRVLDGSAVAGKGPLFTSFEQGDVVADFFAFESTFRDGVKSPSKAANVRFSLESVSIFEISPLTSDPTGTTTWSNA